MDDNNEFDHLQEQPEKVEMLEGQVVSFEQAEAEVKGWLDFKRINAKRRAEGLANPIKHLVNAIAFGQLSIGDDKTIAQQLLYPVQDKDGKTVLHSLSFKPRLTVLDLQSRQQGAAADTLDGQLLATGAALTGQSVGMLKKLDTEDYRTVQAIAVFFQ